MTSSLRMLHMSDFHFSHKMHKTDTSHSHSIPHLTALANRINPSDYNRVVVTGDLSNLGDKQSLINAHAYLFKEAGIGEGEYIGLGLDHESTLVVPGNHDAFNNMESQGKTTIRWQRSLENYNSVFARHKLPVSCCGCSYDWIEHDGICVYMALVDSCYLGDPKLDNSIRDVNPLSRIAKGKLSRKQSIQLLEWFDLGLKGKLLQPGGITAYIDKAKFAQSFKMLVTHHYLFEPEQCKGEHLLQIKDHADVFRNVAMADFDVVLCGHKHVQNWGQHNYGEHLKGRGKKRYILNYFRRHVGIHSLPMQMQLQLRSGRWYLCTKAFSLLTQLLAKGLKRRRLEHDAIQTESDPDRLVHILRQILKERNIMAGEAKQIVTEEFAAGDEVLTPEELDDMQRRIATSFNTDEKIQLGKIAKQMTSLLRRLDKRPFVQAMCGSTAKASRNGSTRRSYAECKITRLNSGYEFERSVYYWNNDINDFDLPPMQESYIFWDDRQPHHKDGLFKSG